MELNTQQQEAVKAPLEGVHLVQALAGSGKTTLLRHRTRYLLRNRDLQGDDKSKILLMAFNKDVAETLKDRLSTDLSSSEFDRLTIRTFHGTAMYMVNRYKSYLPQLQAKINIPKPSHLVTMASDYLSKQKHRLKNSQIKVLIGLDGESTNLNKSIKELFIDRPLLSRELDLDFGEAEHYIKLLRRFRFNTGNLTFSDLLPLANSLPSNCFEDCNYRDLLVDELQDLNFQQRSLIFKFLPYAEQFTGVGDPRQSIYSFQGCDAGIFDKIVNDNPLSKVYPLTKNYRCTEQIIGLANKVLTEELNSTETLLGTNTQGEEPVSLIGAEGLLEWIISKREQNHDWKDIAILFRARSHTPDLEIALATAGIPYTVSNNSFFDQSVVQDIVCYFYLLYHPKPEYGYWRQLVGHFYNMSPEVAEYVWDKTDGYPMTHTISDVPSCLPSNRAYAWRKMWDTLYKYQDIADTKTPSDLAFQIAKDLYDRWAYMFGDDPRTLEYYLEIAESFCKWTEGYGVDGFRVLQTIELRESGKAEEEDSVQVITVHQSKGREWPCVAVWSLSDGLFPHKGGDPDEERRLLYVAVTRAQSSLALVGLRDSDKHSTILRYIPDTGGDKYELIKQADLQD